METVVATDQASERSVGTQATVYEQHPGLWDAKSVPKPDSEEFKALTTCFLEGELRAKFHAPADHSKHFGPEDAGCPSFGDNGTTAVVSAYGDLVSFSRYLGIGESGMFCASQRMSHPYWIQSRAEDVSKACKEKGTTVKIGTSCDMDVFEGDPVIRYVHDRWPCFTYATPEASECPAEAKVQWVARDGLVLQQHTITVKQPASEVAASTFSFKGKLQITDLDHVTGWYPFNEDYPAGYCSMDGPNGYSWVCTHRLTKPREAAAEDPDEDEGPKPPGAGDVLAIVDGVPCDPDTDIVVVVSVFANGKALRWNESKEWEVPFRPDGDGGARIEFTTAYRLTACPRTGGNDWQNYIIPGRDCDVVAILASASFSPLTFSLWDEASGAFDHIKTALADQKLNWVEHDYVFDGDYYIRRQLEYILSVCAIPVVAKAVTRPTPGKPTLATIEESRIAEFESAEVPVAITCGETSLHRVCSSASFFAFMFLLQVDKRLGQMETYIKDVLAGARGLGYLDQTREKLTEMRDTDDPRAELETIASVRGRIRKTIHGHIKWLSAARPLKTGCFAANYWVDGRKVDSSRGGSWVAPDLHPCTAFQFLKIAEFGKHYGEEANNLARQMLMERCQDWLQSLHDTDYREAFAWPHGQDEGTIVFRLDDHVWIWRALKELDSNDVLLVHQLSEIAARRAQEEKEKANAADVKDGARAPDGTAADANVDTDEKTQLREKVRQLLRRFRPEAVQREILARFTAENETSKTRMLAVTRSSRQTRFMLHSRDTAIFHALDSDFIHKGSLELWQNTMDVQPLFSENTSSLNWDNSLRMALAVVLAVRGRSLNNNPPLQQLKHCLYMLIKLADQSGFFAGQVDVNTKEPVLWVEERNRDFYHHAHFEIAYILLEKSREISRHLIRSPQASQPAGQPAASVPEGEPQQEQPLAQLVDQIRQRMSEGRQNDAAGLLAALLKQPGQEPGGALQQALTVGSTQLGRGPNLGAAAGSAPKPTTMKKSMPFSSQIDSRSIVEFGEEWLYNYPACFQRKKPLTKDNVSRTALELSKQLDLADGTSGGVVMRAAQAFIEPAPAVSGAVLHDRKGNAEKQGQASAEHEPQERRSRDQARPSQDQDARSQNQDAQSQKENENLAEYKIFSNKGTAFVMDVERRGRSGKLWRNRNFQVGASHNCTLWPLLNAPRTAKNAKKRLIWMSEATRETALICYLAEHEADRASLSPFFDRHANYERQFFDDTTMPLNKWESELHLSFFQMVELKAKRPEGIPALSVDEFPGIAGKGIARASMGFRFDGDFFDRYWTCYVVDFVPRRQPEPRYDFDETLLLRQWWETSFRDHFPFTGSPEYRQFHQRKVLELFLLERILSELISSTYHIFGEIEKGLAIKQGAVSFAILSSEHYFSSSAQWQRYQAILQGMDEELSAVLLAIEKWETREKDRGQEKPRWTRNDEQKYRTHINKLVGATSRQIRDLRSLTGKVRSLKDTLVSSQEKIRDDLGLRGAENIRFFTYVTVVFLPLGFAASIFSMSGPPDLQSTVGMAVASVSALAITIIALLNARILGAVYEELSLLANRYSRLKMNRSVMYKLHEERKEHRREAERMKSAEEEKQREDNGMPGVDGRSKEKSDMKEKQTRRRPPPKVDESWHVRFWVAYLLIELPARRVLLGYYAARKGQFNYTGILHMLAGLALLPLFVMCWSCQVVILNLADVLVSCRDWVSSLLATLPPEKHGNFDDALRGLTYPSGKWRPIKTHGQRPKDGSIKTPSIKELPDEKENGAAPAPVLVVQDPDTVAGAMV